MWRKKFMGTLMKKRRYALANLLIIYIFKKNVDSVTHTNHSLVSAIIHGFRMMSHMFVLLLYPLQDISRGVRDAGHTHTYTHMSAANVQSMGVDVNHHLVVRGGNKIDEK